MKRARKMSRLVILAAALLAVLGPATARSETAGIDCGCASTGPWGVPVKGTNLSSSSDGVSPHGIYEVTATLDGANERAAITVKRSSDDVVVLSNIQGTNWGFSPDDHRFVYHYQLHGQHFVFLYDLSQSPAKKLWERSSLPSSSRIQFSPTGRYFFYSYVTTSPTGIETSNLEILDAHTGAIRHRRSFILHTAPGDDNTLGAATWGFSPTDGRFVYAHLTSAGQSEWTLVNLETGVVVVTTTLSGTAFWKFSPCGDLIALQVQSTATQQNVRIFRTSDGVKVSPAAHETVSVANVELSTTPTEHLVRIGETHYTLPNTASEACAGGGGEGGGGGGTVNAAPVASFTAPLQPKALIPLDFIDTSTDADGAIETRVWDFGDGELSGAADPSHAYSEPGTYIVSLTVFDTAGASDILTKQLVVSVNAPPTADFSYSPLAPQRRDLVTLTGTSTDDDGISSQSWTVNDLVFSDQATVEVKACETLDVELMVADYGGQTDTKTATIVVSNAGDLVSVPAGADLAAAVGNACPNDTLLLAGAEYEGGVNLQNVNLRGRGAGVTIIRGTVPENDSWVVVTGGHAVTIEDVTIADGGLDGRGGGVLARTSGSTNLIDVEVRRNAGHGGVEVHSAVDTAQIRDAFVHHNQGGGIRMFCCAELAVTGSEISFNTSAEDGAGASLQEASITFSGNYVHDNVSEGSGGGLYLAIADGQILNNRFIGNSAVKGGGVSLRDSTALVAGNLIAENGGGGIYRSATAGNEVTVADSTIANNDGDGVTNEVDPTFGMPMAMFNTIVTGNVADIVGDLGPSGNNLIGAPAGLVGDGNYHLAAGSPAIDAGDNSQVPLGLAEDTDGDDRILDGDGDGTATVDIGYDEAAAAAADVAPPTVTATPDRVPDHVGWYTAPVTITFSATDTGSGVATCDAPVVYGGPDTAGTSVTGTCTDNAGNVGTVSFDLRLDRTGPVVIAPADLTLATDAGTCIRSLVDAGAANATDDLSATSVSGARADGAAIDAAYALGTTVITWIGTDAAGNQSTALQKVTVEDHEKPVVHAPADVTASSDTVDPGTATAEDNCPGLGSVTGARSDGKPLAAGYPAGTTTIVWKANDAAGNEGSATQSVTVVPRDSVPPNIIAPSGIVVDATKPAGAMVTFAVTATDNVDPSPAVICIPGSGSTFPIGTTIVSCSASDGAGNTSHASFSVRVNGAAQLLVRLVDKTLVFVDAPALSVTLRASLERIAAALANRPATTCTLLTAYVAAVNGAPARAGLTSAEKAELAADTNRIKAVLGCR